MANRVRPIRKEICLTEQEEQVIKSKMAELGTHNFGSYARKMQIDGYIINVDYTELRKLCAAVSKIGSYDGSKSLPGKLLAHMAKESEKESEKR